MYGIINGVSDGQSLDNGWYLLVFYFGWLGLILLVISFFIGLKVILTGARESAILAFFLLLSPFFTGAVFSPEFLFLQMIPLLAYRIKYQNEY
jgi:putative colanic acid polymerase